MKRFTALFVAASMMLVFGLFSTQDVNAQTTDHGSEFVDENGDGYNDNAPDADGDGIPNGQDPDYVAPGTKAGKGAATGFVDEDGDGVNDNAPDADGDGIPNGQDEDFVKPEIGQGQNAGQGGKGAKGKGARGANSFVDEDGDGINDNAPDADGDGIPNGQDEDFVRPENSGRFGKGAGKAFHGFPPTGPAHSSEGLCPSFPCSTSGSPKQDCQTTKTPPTLLCPSAGR